ncbi:hypothetical protein [Mangrovimonas spongiae]|uniref:DUF4412 domain-containing protein n=1 Tax=Mangrovimonas spongiae TaxID=2494697 RepID=A0A3R9N793_9FLAO|nr:hypothetical protein [Mangrovimonas spongiae]RSK40605.1 hypothetical protein EJA19_06400 [Mangrovimonas spongiae]
MKRLALYLFVSVFCASLVAQEKITEGVMSSTIKLSSSNSQMNSQFAMIGDISSVTYFKGNKTRTEAANPMTGTSTVIIDNATKKMLAYVNNAAMGKKYMQDSIQPSEDELKNVTVEKGTETKTILGYTCQQYFANLKEDGATVNMELYTTDKLPAVSDKTAVLGGKVKGYPLYLKMEAQNNGMDMIMTTEVTEIKQETVAEDKFNMTPPEGYTKTNNLNGI